MELTDFETIYFQLNINGELVNFLSSYKSPSTKNQDYLTKLENYKFLLDPNEPLVVVGDLNMDLKSSEGNDLKDFLINNEMKNYVNVHTRIARTFYKKKTKLC